MRLNPLSALSKAAASPVKTGPVKEDVAKDDARSKGEQLAKQVELSNYREIKDPKDLKGFELTDDKKIRARLQKTAAKTIKAVGGINEAVDFHITGPFHDKSLRIPEAKMVANMKGEEALKRYFKTGLLYKLFGWVPRLFGYSDKAIGAKWLKANSGSMIFDPKGEHSKLDDLSLVKDKLKSGRFALSVIYKADDKGNFSKEPEALVLVDTFDNVIADIKEHSNPVFKARAKNMQAEGLDSFFMPESLIFNPKSKGLDTSDEVESRRYRKGILSAWVETHDDDANIIVPGPLFHDDEIESRHHLLEKIHDMSFLYHDPESVGLFRGEGTLVRSKHNKYKIPEVDLSTMLAMAMVSEHSKDYTKLSKKFKQKLEEDLDQVIDTNTKAFKQLNERLGL